MNLIGGLISSLRCITLSQFVGFVYEEIEVQTNDGSLDRGRIIFFSKLDEKQAVKKCTELNMKYVGYSVEPLLSRLKNNCLI